MPNNDGTGPQGKGPRTGRGMGNCGRAGDSSNNRRQGRGQGNGMGRRFSNNENRA